MAAANWHAYRSFSRDRSVTQQRLNKGIVRRIASYARPYRWTLALFLVCTCVTAVFTVAVPLLLKTIIDKGILAHDTTVVLEVAGLVAALAVAGALISVLTRWLSARTGEGLIYDLRTEVFRHVQRQPIAFFTRAQTGSLVSRLNNDVIGAQQAITSTLASVVSNALTLLLVLIAMLSLSWLVTVVALVLLPLFVIPARLVGRRLQRYTRESMQLDAEMGSTMTERFNVAGAMLVKLFGNAENEQRVFAGRAAKVRDIGVITAMYGSTLFIALSLLASMATAVVYGLGGGLVIHGAFQLGTLVALTALLARLYGPITALSNVQVDVMTALVSFDRVFEVLDLQPLITERPGAVPLPAPAGGNGGAPARPRPASRVRQGLVPLPNRQRGVAGVAGVDRAARAGARRRRAGRAARGELHRAVGEADGPGRAVRRGQDHHHPPGGQAVRPPGGNCQGRRPRPARPHARFAA